MQTRRGFTLIEVLIAVVIMDIGLLALVGTSAILVRQRNELRTRAAALHTASNRLQRLGISECLASTGVADAAPGVYEHWAVELPQSGMRDIRDSVTFAIAGSTRALVLRTRLPC